MSRIIRFCFDYISPYAYLAWTQMEALALRHACELSPVPVLFAGLLNAHGTRGPAEVPARRRYLMKDVVRIAAQFKVPISVPFSHPFNPLLALRVSSVPELSPASRAALVDALYQAAWVKRLNVSDPETVGHVVESIGLSRALLSRAEDADVKARLKAQTEEAIAAGVFGVPSMLVDGELFWGTDSLPHLERFLEGCDPVPPNLAEIWEHLPATAIRKQAGPPPQTGA